MAAEGGGDVLAQGDGLLLRIRAAITRERVTYWLQRTLPRTPMPKKKNEKAVKAIEKAVKKAMRRGMPQKSVEKAVGRAINKESKPKKNGKKDKKDKSSTPVE